MQTIRQSSQPQLNPLEQLAQAHQQVTSQIAGLPSAVAYVNTDKDPKKQAPKLAKLQESVKDNLVSKAKSLSQIMGGQ